MLSVPLMADPRRISVWSAVAYDADWFPLQEERRREILNGSDFCMQQLRGTVLNVG